MVDIWTFPYYVPPEQLVLFFPELNDDPFPDAVKEYFLTMAQKRMKKILDMVPYNFVG